MTCADEPNCNGSEYLVKYIGLYTLFIWDFKENKPSVISAEAFQNKILLNCLLSQ